MASNRKIKVVICDNDKLIHHKIEAYIKKYEDGMELESLISHCYSGKEYINQKEICDILFLGSSLSDYDGIQTGRELRKRGDKCQIIMIVECEKRAAEAFEIEVSRLLVKPFSYDIFSKYYSDVIKKIPLMEQKIKVKAQYGYTYISASQIEYMCTYGNYVKIHLLDGKIFEQNKSLSKFVRELGNLSFVKCHQSFCVNINYIKGVEINHLVMTSGAKISVSREGKKSIVEALEGR